jgi:hypothetical protein
MQSFLDPQNSHVTSQTKEKKLDWYTEVNSTNPHRSCIPNISDWKAGDTVLFSKLASGFDLVGTFIEEVQKRGFGQPDEDSRWVHAAVYIGNGLCVEAVAQTSNGRNGVLVDLKSLPVRWGCQMVRVRRMISNIWTPEVGRDIAMYALGRTAHPYPNLWQFAATIVTTSFPKAGARVKTFFASPSGPEPVHCSLLCSHSIQEATGIDVFGVPNVQSFPYALSQSAFLEDVHVEWREIK